MWEAVAVIDGCAGDGGGGGGGGGGEPENTTNDIGRGRPQRRTIIILD